MPHDDPPPATGPLDALMRDFARITGASGFEVSNAGQTWFCVADRFHVCVQQDTVTHRMHLAAPVGPMAPGDAPELQHLDIANDAGWLRCTEHADGFEWSLRWHVDTGLLLATGSAATNELDAVRFGEMVTHFVERLTACDMSHDPSSAASDA